MKFKLTAEGNVIEQLHNHKRSILVSMFQTTKCLIFSFKAPKQSNQTVLLDALREMTVQRHQLAKTVYNSIINFMNHHYFPLCNPSKVNNTDSPYPSKIRPLAKEAVNQNSSVRKQSLCRFHLPSSSLFYFYNNFLFTTVCKITYINFVKHNNYCRFKYRGYVR